MTRRLWICYYSLLSLLCACSAALAVTENFNTFFTGLTSASTPLGAGDKMLVLQGGVDKAIAANSIVTLNDPQTLTNKTISGANNTLSVNATNQLSGVAPVANGGTGLGSGTSGGVLCATGSTTYAFSSALTANIPLIGGGAGACPGVGSVSGNTTKFVSNTGTTPPGQGGIWDSNGNWIANANAVYTNVPNNFSAQQTFASSLATQNPQGGTTYTFANTDCGVPVLFTSASPVTATAPNTLPTTCTLVLVQGGAGRVTVTNGGSGNASYTSPYGFTGTYAQGAILSLYVYGNVGGSAATMFMNGVGS